MSMNYRNLIPFARRKGTSQSLWDPLSSLHRSVDRLFDEFSRGIGAGEESGPFFFSGTLPHLDMEETDKEMIITADVPGIETQDLDIRLKDNMLTISGTKKVERNEDEKNYHLIERYTGSFTRTIHLPSEVEEDKIEAENAKGVLTIRLPKMENKKDQPKQIKIKST